MYHVPDRAPCVHCRLDEGLSSLSLYINLKNKTDIQFLAELQYVDDLVLLAHLSEELQRIDDNIKYIIIWMYVCSAIPKTNEDS